MQKKNVNELSREMEMCKKSENFTVSWNEPTEQSNISISPKNFYQWNNESVCTLWAVQLRNTPDTQYELINIFIWQ